MRFIEPELGETRIIKKLALIPITIGRETRWLEIVKLKQEYKEMANLCAEVVVPCNEWINVEFL